MIIVCQKCDTRLQVDDAKVPTKPFVIKCPKCNSSVDSGLSSAALEQGATSLGGSPATEHPRFDEPTPAPLFELEQANPAGKDVLATERLAELLSGLLNQAPGSARSRHKVRASWDTKKALVCVTEELRDATARGLAENGYQVFVAHDTRQAVDRMRENLLDVVVLDPRFDPVEQGSVFVTREVNILRPAQRRRLFFVLLSPSLRTMDSHTAFLNNVNAIVNVNEINELPKLIQHRVREYNELYREFNHSLGVPDI